MTHHTDAEQERASLGAFIDRAGRDGFDTAHTFFDCGGVVFFNPDTADLWGFWQAARRAPAAPVQKGDYLDGVNIPRLREALTFLGRGNGVGEGEVANKLSEHVNSITRAVLACKELLRQGAPAAPVPKGWKLVPDEANMTDEQAEAICRLANVCGGGAYGIYRAALAAAPQPPQAEKP